MGSGKRQEARILKELQSRSRQRLEYMIQVELYLSETGMDNISYLDLLEMPIAAVDDLLMIAENINKRSMEQEKKRMTKKENKMLSKAFK